MRSKLKPPIRKRWSKPQLGVALAVLLAASLAGAAAPRDDAPARDLPARARQALSTLAGEISLGGLQRPVEVLRDRWGIPHIYAGTLEDLFFAQGFVQAQDRLFQMELWRRSTQGRLAETFGDAYVERDRLARLLRYRGSLDDEWRSYDPEARRIATSFVRGINAFVERRRERPPLELTLAGLELERWAPEDLLARVEAFVMSGNARGEVSRARLVQQAGPGLAWRLRPPSPWVAPSVPAGLRLDAIDERLAGALAQIGGGLQAGDGDAEEGSNNWVVAGARTATGRPLLANDPHRPLDHPSLRYLVHLDGPGFKVAGAVTPWFPGVAIGHNERVAWGLTIFRIDAQDIVVEQLKPDDPRQYRVGEAWQAVDTSTETILVRGGAAVPVELRYTRHGPLVHEDRARGLAYALRWTGSEPGTAGYLAGLALDRAGSAAEFREALRRWKMPGENFVFADVAGEIGYQAAGLAPRRVRGDGLLPVPGADGLYDWRGFLRLEDLPHAANPPEGFLATANHNTLPPDYPHVVNYEWSDPFRIERVRELLGRQGRVSIADFQAFQNDVESLPARSLVPLLEPLMLDNRDLREARETLLRWNRRLERDSPAAALYEAWQRRLVAAYWRRVLDGADTSVDASLIRSASLWATLAEMRGRPDAGLLVEALQAAIEDLGPSWRSLRWGTLHTARFRHPLSRDPASRELLDRGPLARSGDGFTVNATGGSGWRQSSGASFREILDLSDWDRSLVTTAPGESGQPGSPHFDDFLPVWGEGRYVPLAFSRARVEALARHRLLLVPAVGADATDPRP